jgi:dihydropyrimidinase
MTAEDPGDLIVHGGTVVNATESTPATVVISGGRIRSLLDPDLPLPDNARAIDASGSLVIPGGVDPHCHIGQRLGEYAALDDYEQASRAALWGGTTTVIDFAIPDPGQSPLDAVIERRALAQPSRCDTALHGCVITWDDSTAGQIEQMVALGVRTIKLFTTYRDVVMAGPDTILEVLRALHQRGGLGYVHAEANHVIEDAQELALAVHRGGSRDMGDTRPEIAESAAVAQVLATAEHLGAPVYFVHQTTAEAVDLVRAARRRGVRAYTETCPHYLTLDESVYAGNHPERYVCCPPIRNADTVAQLRSRAVLGDVDALGSDHCCYSTTQKLEHHDDVTRMPNGVPGVETRLPVAFTQLVEHGGMSLERFVASGK